MFVCNLKINGKKIWKVTLAILIVLIILLLFFSGKKIFNFAKNSMDENLDISNILEINTNNYTNFLKDSHEHLDNYIGKCVKITGYVYRLPDFTNNEFVIARTMVTTDNSAVVVGILCECSDGNKYDTGSWIEVTGTIQKGNYNGEIPILQISNIKSIKAPNDEFVQMPTD